MDEQFFWNSLAQIKYTAIIGFMLGGPKGAKMASLQHQVENMHHTLRYKSHYIAYFRKRNYRMMKRFCESGARMSMRLAKFPFVGSLTYALVSYISESRGAEVGVYSGLLSGSIFAVERYPTLWRVQKSVALGLLLGIVIHFHHHTVRNKLEPLF